MLEIGNTDEEIASNNARLQTLFVFFCQVVVKPSGIKWNGCKGVSFHDRQEVKSICDAAISLLWYLEPGDGILLEDFCDPSDEGLCNYLRYHEYSFFVNPPIRKQISSYEVMMYVKTRKENNFLLSHDWYDFLPEHIKEPIRLVCKLFMTKSMPVHVYLNNEFQTIFHSLHVPFLFL